MQNDKIFTPKEIVQLMLYKIRYVGYNLRKTIFEPSFGNGNFLVEIVSRIIDYATSRTEILTLLDNVYGCEIDKTLYDETISRLNALLEPYNITYDWHNLVNCDALDYPDKEFDYVVGNPPYIRIHDLDVNTRTKLKDYKFCTGTSDLYIAFFELGLKHLKPNGKLAYITPNSFLRNTSQRKFRKSISSNVSSIIDYATVPVFGNILTYTCITVIEPAYQGTCEYIKMSDIGTMEYETAVDIAGQSDWRFMNADDAEFIRILSTKPRTFGDICDIRYGVATNADKIYIDPIGVDADMMRPAIKASTLEEHEILYPYVKGTTPIPMSIMQHDYPDTYTYLCNNREVLEERDMDICTPFYRYARSQGLININHPKFVLQHIISPDAQTCAFREVSAETIVYSGMFIIPHEGIPYDTIHNVLSSEEFCRYCKLMGKDMSGSWKSVNTKTVRQFPIE